MNEKKPLEVKNALNMEKYKLIDVREKDEYDLEHIEGAIHLPKGELKEKIDSLGLTKEQPIILMCATGNRSSISVGILEYLGYKNVYNMKGGLKAWKVAGFIVSNK